MLRNASKDEGMLTQVAFCNAIFVAVTVISVVVKGFPATPVLIAWMAVNGLVGRRGQSASTTPRAALRRPFLPRSNTPPS